MIFPISSSFPNFKYICLELDAETLSPCERI